MMTNEEKELAVDFVLAYGKRCFWIGSCNQPATHILFFRPHIVMEDHHLSCALYCDSHYYMPKHSEIKAYDLRGGDCL